MPPIRNLIINFDMNGKKSLILNDLKTTDTVGHLKQVIIDRECQNKRAKGIRLIYLGKPLEGDNKKLIQYKIKSNSQLTAVIRLPGGSGEDSNPINEEELKKLDIKIVKKHCQIGTNESCSSDGTKRIQMPECGYKCTYCYTCLKDRYKVCIFTGGNTDVICGLGTQCGGSTLDWERVFKTLQLSEDEEKECYKQTNKNGIEKSGTIKLCPGCECYVEKLGIDHNRVRCNKRDCPLKKDWCFSCGNEWKGTSSNYKICGNDTCEDNKAAVRTDILLNCERKDIPYNSIKNCPTTRECPMCESFVEWVSNCKHITCVNRECKHEFCLSCTEKWISCKCKNCENDNSGCSNGKGCNIIEPSDLL